MSYIGSMAPCAYPDMILYPTLSSTPFTTSRASEATKDKTYPCSEPGCDKSFTTNWSRSRHLQSIHGKSKPSRGTSPTSAWSNPRNMKKCGSPKFMYVNIPPSPTSPSTSPRLQSSPETEPLFTFSDNTSCPPSPLNPSRPTTPGGVMSSPISASPVGSDSVKLKLKRTMSGTRVLRTSNEFSPRGCIPAMPYAPIPGIQPSPSIPPLSPRTPNHTAGIVDSSTVLLTSVGSTPVSMPPSPAASPSPVRRPFKPVTSAQANSNTRPQHPKPHGCFPSSGASPDGSFAQSAVVASPKRHPSSSASPSCAPIPMDPRIPAVDGLGICRPTAVHATAKKAAKPKAPVLPLTGLPPSSPHPPPSPARQVTTGPAVPTPAFSNIDYLEASDLCPVLDVDAAAFSNSASDASLCAPSHPHPSLEVIGTGVFDGDRGIQRNPKGLGEMLQQLNMHELSSSWAAADELAELDIARSPLMFLHANALAEPLADF
eukprot:Rmarinus@m.11717